MSRSWVRSTATATTTVDGDGDGGRQRLTATVDGDVLEDATAGLAGGYFAKAVPFHLYLTAFDPLQGRMRGS